MKKHPYFILFCALVFWVASSSWGDFTEFVWSRTGDNGSWSAAANWSGPTGQYPDDPDERAVFNSSVGMGMPIQTATMSNGLGQLVFNYTGWTVYTDYKPLRLDPYSVEGSYNAIFSYAQGGSGVNLIYPEIELLQPGLNIHTASGSTLAIGWSGGGGFIGSYAPVISSLNPANSDTGAVRLDGPSSVSSPFYLRQGTLLVRYVGTGDALGTSTGTLNIGGDQWVTDGAWARLLTDASGAAVTKNLRVRSYPGANVNAVLGSNHTSGSSTFSGTVQLDLNAALTAAGSSTVSFTNTISGTGGITKTGSGTVRLSGSNTYQGVTNISSGTLQLGGNNRLPTGTSVTLANAAGATLDLAGYNQTIAALNGGGASGGTVALGGGQLTVGEGYFAGVISGAGSLVKSGSGVLALSGGNTYGGATTINGGTLRIGRSNCLPTITDLTVASEALFELGIFSQTIASLSGAGEVSMSSGQLAVGSGSFAGLLSGVGSLEKVGSGILTLSGANSYSGQTRISGGTLRLGGHNCLPISTFVSLADASGVTLDLAGYNQSITVLSGGGTNGGTVALGGGQFTVNGGGLFAGTITGGGSLVKSGGGTLTLSGLNDYTGATSVTGGKLLVNGQHLNGGNYTVAAGALLGGVGRIEADVFVEPGGILAPGVMVGSLSVGGNVELDGLLQIQLEGGIMPGDCTRLIAEGILSISNATLDLHWAGMLREPAYIFAQYGQLDGSEFGQIIKLPAGYRIDYNYQGGNQIALVLIPEPASVVLLGLGGLLLRFISKKR
ncbi:MAG TPA: autotransporter-associated beta strand repeat-containing protein [Anaerohalosphaeraceae bacterium]|nr:autotransporter-associated beta strand repeat-containing protein [Anaerohalosphaeraceae bacterium]